MRPTPAVLALGALAVAGSCTFPATEVLVVLGTDAPDDRVLTVSATVVANGAATGTSQAWVRGPGVVGGVVFPASFAIVPTRPGAADAIELRVAAALAPGTHGEPTVTFERVARFRLTTRQTSVVRVFLAMACGGQTTGCQSVSADACTVAVRCAEQMLTCGDRGECVSPDLTPAPLERDDASVQLPFDAGSDAVTMDAPVGADAPLPDVPSAMDVPDASTTCVAPMRLCAGAGCVAPDDPAHCGTCTTTCAAPVGGTATCTAGMCDFRCDATHHLCSGACAANNSVTACGATCVPCPTAPNATPTCDGASCGVVCNPGFHFAGTRCVVDTGCGNGALDGAETCDDGNATAGDGCSPGCRVETTSQDACPGAFIRTAGVFVGTTAGTSTNFMFRCGNPAPDVAYAFVPAVSGMLSASVTATGGVDPLLSTSTACGTGFASCVTGRSDGIPITIGASVTAGATRWFYVSSQSVPGPFTIRFTLTPG